MGGFILCSAAQATTGCKTLFFCAKTPFYCLSNSYRVQWSSVKDFSKNFLKASLLTMKVRGRMQTPHQFSLPPETGIWIVLTLIGPTAFHFIEMPPLYVPVNEKDISPGRPCASSQMVRSVIDLPA